MIKKVLRVYPVPNALRSPVGIIVKEQHATMETRKERDERTC